MAGSIPVMMWCDGLGLLLVSAQWDMVLGCLVVYLGCL
jgi:hypothetical protein